MSDSVWSSSQASDAGSIPIARSNHLVPSNNLAFGRVVVLVNEHTASAGEMVAAFAEENQLATIVGTKTPGRLLSGSAFKAGFGYIVGLPVAAYLTWEGSLIEGEGVAPNIPVALSPEQLLAGEDPQMQKALELVRTL
jgi:carboxyl-terminal processing protease